MSASASPLFCIVVWCLVARNDPTADMHRHKDKNREGKRERERGYTLTHKHKHTHTQMQTKRPTDMNTLSHTDIHT